MYNVDEEGFLVNPSDWDRAFARETAAVEGIDLNEERWRLIEQTRGFYNEYGFSPSMRPLVKYIGMNLGADKGKSIYLMKLFPPSPAKILSKLAGLHKPKNCL
ncbi:MAG: TusE/DsrC/DsvC family sulfur relay protein [Porticoccaceae bacterium]|nr:TusE/DsrC/DsvC family sulfur relay protein [Porticoccaceae bacterium]